MPLLPDSGSKLKNMMATFSRGGICGTYPSLPPTGAGSVFTSWPNQWLSVSLGYILGLLCTATICVSGSDWGLLSHSLACSLGSFSWSIPCSHSLCFIVPLSCPPPCVVQLVFQCFSEFSEGKDSNIWWQSGTCCLQSLMDGVGGVAAAYRQETHLLACVRSEAGTGGAQVFVLI